MRGWSLAGAGLLAVLAGCDRPSPAEQAARDARDVAMVEAAQDRKPPVVPLQPEPIAYADIEAQDLFGAGCAFIAGGTGAGDPVLVANGSVGAMKVDGQVMRFAADSGSAELPYATRERYTSKTHDLLLTKGPGEGVQAGDEVMHWPGSLTVRDRWQRKVYAATGTLECGA